MARPAALGPHREPARSGIPVWCLGDGRPGHRRQIEGLVRQLGERRPVSVHWIDARSMTGTELMSAIMRRRFPPGDGLPDPHLILASGHATHVPALAAQRARGGKTVVLMRPTLPPFLFDVCLVPEHDLHSLVGRLTRFGAIVTRGVLNPFTPSSGADARRGLILVGGPSRHHAWSDTGLLAQICDVIRLSPMDVRWTVTTSRRTPLSFVHTAEKELSRHPAAGRVEIVPGSETQPTWLPDQLRSSRTVFVTEDSVSMVYESLTVGAEVGILNVPRRGQSRNSRCIDRLLADGLVVSYDAWRVHRFEHRRQVRFHEASRCADILCVRLLDAA